MRNPSASVSSEFDIYTDWLGIPPGPRPPDYYTLLGLTPASAVPEAIEQAANERNLLVRPRCLKYPDEGSALLNEISAAKVCLLDSEARALYDQALARACEEEETVPAEGPVDAPMIGGAQTAHDVVAAATLASRFCPHCGRRMLPKATFCVDCAASAVGHADRWLPGAGSVCQQCGKALTAGQVICHHCQHDHALERKPKLPGGAALHRPFMARRISLGQLELARTKDQPAAIPTEEPPEAAKADSAQAGAREGKRQSQKGPLPGREGAPSPTKTIRRWQVALLPAVAFMFVVLPLAGFAWFVNGWGARTSPADNAVAPTPAPALVPPTAHRPVNLPAETGVAVQVPAASDAGSPFAAASTPDANLGALLQSGNGALDEPLMAAGSLALLIESVARSAQENPGNAELELLARQLLTLQALREEIEAARDAQSFVSMVDLDGRIQALREGDPLPRATITKLHEYFRNQWLTSRLEEAMSRADALLAESGVSQALGLVDEPLPEPLEPLRDIWKTRLRKHVMEVFEAGVASTIDQAAQLAEELQFVMANDLLSRAIDRAEPVNPRMTQTLKESRLKILMQALDHWSQLSEPETERLKEVFLTDENRELRRLAEERLAAVPRMARGKKSRAGSAKMALPNGDDSSFEPGEMPVGPGTRTTSGKRDASADVAKRNFGKEKIRVQSLITDRKQLERFQVWYTRLDASFDKGAGFVSSFSGNPVVYDGLAELAYAVTMAEVAAGGKEKFKFNPKRDVKSYSNRQKAEQALERSNQ
jgi:hypothetical protein